MVLYIQVCQFCLSFNDRSPPDDAECRDLQAALQKAGIKVNVVSARCLGVCSSPVSLTIQSIEGASYIFKDIDLKEDEADIISTCKLYLDADHGWIEDARECGRLRYLLHAKIPAI